MVARLIGMALLTCAVLPAGSIDLVRQLRRRLGQRPAANRGLPQALLTRTTPLTDPTKALRKSMPAAR